MSWIGTSPSPPRSARSSTALIAYSPFAEIRIRQHALVVFRRRPASSRTATLQEARRLAREVGDHHIGARPPDRDEGLQHGALLVEPAQAARGPDHRLLSGAPVGGQWPAKLRLRARPYV